MAGISSKSLSNTPLNRYKFNNGTEINEKFDINLYETIFRTLDPQLGKFWQIDPLADAAYEYSPFAYGNNNPIIFSDPLGLISDTTGTPGFSPDNPKVLENVTLTSKPKVGGQFLPYIKFPNNRPRSIASHKDWPLSISKDRSNDLLDSWAMGLGAENRIYLPNHPMTKRLQNAFRIDLARAYFYKKYLTKFKAGQSLKGASVTNYDGKFGLIGLLMAGTDLVEQFIGSFKVDIHVDQKGENLLFFVSNTTSSTSAFYHLANSHERVPGKWTPMGNMNQVFIWQEPISSSGFNVITSQRPPVFSPVSSIVGATF